MVVAYSDPDRATMPAGGWSEKVLICGSHHTGPADPSGYTTRVAWDPTTTGSPLGWNNG